MPCIFSHGSLQKPAVQLAVFGRLLAGIPDVLDGFERVAVWHGDKQLEDLVRGAAGRSRIEGMAFEISDAELEIADAYEAADGYARIPIELASGMRAWVYVDRSGGPARS